MPKAEHHHAASNTSLNNELLERSLATLPYVNEANCQRTCDLMVNFGSNSYMGPTNHHKGTVQENVNFGDSMVKDCDQVTLSSILAGYPDVEENATCARRVRGEHTAKKPANETIMGEIESGISETAQYLESFIGLQPSHSSDSSKVGECNSGFPNGCTAPYNGEETNTPQQCKTSLYRGGPEKMMADTCRTRVKK